MRESPKNREIICRSAVAEDYNQIVTMCKSSMVATYGGFLDEEAMRPWAEGIETDNYVRKMLSEMIVAEENGKIVGVVCINNDEIDLLWIHIERRRNGIGKKLMEKAEVALSERDYKEAKLECAEPNTPAMKFYRKLGWNERGKFLDEMSGVNKVIMQKDIDPRLPKGSR